MNHIVVTMTTIYGRARLQVTSDHEHVGWVDLDLGVTVIERPDLAADPALASNAGRDVRAAELYAAIDAWCAAHDGDAVLAALEAAQVPASSVFSVADMFRDAQFLARGMIESAALADGTPLKVPGIVPRLTGTPGATEWLGPTLGEHTDAILAELGYPPDAVNALRENGAI